MANRNLEIVVPHHGQARCLQLLHQLEDQDAATGIYTASDGAATLLDRLQDQPWVPVTSNYAHRVRTRLAGTDLPEPPPIIDAAHRHSATGIGGMFDVVPPNSAGAERVVVTIAVANPERRIVTKPGDAGTGRVSLPATMLRLAIPSCAGSHFRSCRFWGGP